MNLNHLNALRLGFSTQSAPKIKSLGLDKYIDNQLDSKITIDKPAFIANSPKNLLELYALKQQEQDGIKKADTIGEILRITNFEWKAYLLKNCYESDFPLRMKINLFFQNHFVVTQQSVKLPLWIYKHFETINNNALGNYKLLVKEMVYSNAMIRYLDNHQNKKGKINENLGRELLELFTLGEGHYTENDIKNTALSLAGLNFGEEKGMYRPQLKDDTIKTVFGKSGNFSIDEVIDIIFEQPNTPYFLAEKALKWFFYDKPSKELVLKYGNVLLKNNFELKPFFRTLFTEECINPRGGNQIKNPISFLLQVHYDLNLKPNYKLLVFLLKNQAMDIYDQPNVKGWKGGKEWLTSQTYADRNQFIDVVIDGNERYLNAMNKRLEKFNIETIAFNPTIKLNNSSNAKSILEELTDRMIFETNNELDMELNQLLKYDFDSKAPNAQKNILKVYQYLAKSPEFQII